MLIAIRRDQDHRQDTFDLANDLHRLQPAQLGEVHIKQGEMDFLTANDLDRFLATLRQVSSKTNRLEDVSKRLTGALIIVGDQDRIWAIEGHLEQTYRGSDGLGKSTSGLAMQSLGHYQKQDQSPITSSTTHC